MKIKGIKATILGFTALVWLVGSLAGCGDDPEEKRNTAPASNTMGEMKDASAEALKSAGKMAAQTVGTVGEMSADTVDAAKEMADDAAKVAGDTFDSAKEMGQAVSKKAKELKDESLQGIRNSSSE